MFLKKKKKRPDSFSRGFSFPLKKESRFILLPSFPSLSTRNDRSKRVHHSTASLQDELQSSCSSRTQKLFFKKNIKTMGLREDPVRPTECQPQKTLIAHTYAQERKKKPFESTSRCKKAMKLSKHFLFFLVFFLFKRIVDTSVTREELPLSHHRINRSVSQNCMHSHACFSPD